MLLMAGGGCLRSNAEPHIDAIDSLRGIAACIVAFIFHLRSFGSGVGAIWYLQIEPFKCLYDFGNLGVDLFFVLSGFVFAYKYAKPISERSISAYDFSFCGFRGFIHCTS